MNENEVMTNVAEDEEALHAQEAAAALQSLEDDEYDESFAPLEGAPVSSENTQATPGEEATELDADGNPIVKEPELDENGNPIEFSLDPHLTASGKIAKKFLSN
jgi:hypothetical protein